jgi:hypothetical protein
MSPKLPGRKRVAASPKQRKEGSPINTGGFAGNDSEKPRAREDEFYDNMDAISRRLKQVESVMDAIKSLAAKIEHSWPHLATKEDIAKSSHSASAELSMAKEELVREINNRPTTTMVWVIISASLMFGALPFLPDWWHKVSSIFASSPVTNPQSQLPQVQEPRARQ